jgi:hypothetical protein
MFQVFHLDVAKEDLGCCICCNDNIRMFKAYVSSISCVFRCMFEVFHLDVAYIAMALLACFKRMFPVFHMFHNHIVSVSSGCYKSRYGCCICCYAYTLMFQTHVLSVSSVFKRMLQIFHLDVLKVDRNVARHRWLVDSGLPQPCVNPRGHAGTGWAQGRGPATGAGAGARRDADVRAWSGIRTRGVDPDAGGGAASGHGRPGSGDNFIRLQF